METIDARLLAGNSYQHRRAQPMARDLRVPLVNETGEIDDGAHDCAGLLCGHRPNAIGVRTPTTTRNQFLFSYTMETAVSHKY